MMYKLMPFIGMLVLLFCANASGVNAQYYDYAGSVHIHTVYSDGSGTFEDIAGAAQKAGLDFLVTSDHNTLKPLRDGKEKWYDNVLVLVGTEISLESGHYLAMDTPWGFSCQGMTTQGCINAVNRAGGFGFLAHPVSKWEWKDWSASGYTGMEIVNLANLFDNTAEAYRPGIAVRVLRTYPLNPLGAMMTVTQNRPDADLKRWDELLSINNKVVGIGASDAHARVTIGGRDLRIPTYEESFRSVQTYILADRTLSGNLAADKSIVYSALRNGRAFTVFGLVGNARGTRFTASNGQASVVMGQSMAVANAAVRLAVTTPGVSGVEIRLMRNGRQVERTQGSSLTYSTRSAGVYRVEVYRNYQGRLRPWIFTNPIYLR